MSDLSIRGADAAAERDESGLNGQVPKEQLAYWAQQIGGSPPPLELPADRPRPAVQTCEVARQALELPQPLTDGLRALSQQEGAPLFTTLLAGFNTLLYRYTGQEDILVGAAALNGGPNSQRAASSEQKATGTGFDSVTPHPLPNVPCSTPIALLRTDLSGNPTFRELLRRVRAVVETGAAHPDVPFETLLEELRSEPDPSRHPLFQVLFAFQESAASPQTTAGPGGFSWNEECGTSPYELTLALRETPADLAGCLEYNTHLFDSDTMARMRGHFQTLLESIAADPEQRLSQLPLLTGAERHHLLVELNDTAVAFPADKCIHELFEAQVEQHPDAVAAVFKGEQLTYEELNRRANQLAHYLRSLGVGPEVLVGICVERSLETVIGLLGIAKAGGAYVPLDPAYPKDRLAFMLEDTQAPVLLTQEGLLEKLPEHQAHVICLDRDWAGIARENTANPDSGVAPENLLYVIYTSGSTGRPKAAVLDHRGRVNNFCDFNRRFSVVPGDRLLALSSLSFDMSAYDVFGTLAAGGTIVLPEPCAALDPARWAQLMIQHAVTVWHSVPALLEMLVDYVWERAELWPRSLRLVLLGGDWIPLSLPNRIKTLAEGVRVISMGGATEVSMDSTIYAIERTDPNWKSIPYGAPMANQLAYVLDRYLQPVPVGVPGELHLGGVGVGRGYLNRPELTAEKFIPNPFRPGERLYKTGDLARYRRDGNLELLGRIDFQVKIRGIRIELGEIEAALRQHSAVRECVVLAREFRQREKRLVAYVVQDPAYLGSSEEVRQWQEAQVSQWQMVYDTAYSRPSDQDDPTFNIVSWDSSYTGRPLPAVEMQEWVEQSVARIRALKPRRVLEIGCGMGLLLFRIARDCERYWGTDISPVALEYVAKELKRQPLPQVSLFQRGADNFAGIEPGSFDAIVLNSIVMDFPSGDYLLRVLKGAARCLAPGGVIFVGDVRNLALLEAFATSVQLHKAPASLPKQQLQQRIHKQIRLEEELVIDPAFFAALPQSIPEIDHVQIHLKRGSAHNELTKFRYDLTLHVCPPEAAPVFRGQWLDWQKEALSLAAVRRLLREREPEQLGIRRVPNARLLAEVRMAQRLAEADAAQTAGRLRECLAEMRRLEPGLDPEAFWHLADEFPYAVDVRYAQTGEQDCFDVVLLRQAGADTYGPVLLPGSQVDRQRPLQDWVNNPLQAKVARRLAPELRRYLQERLPEALVPSAFVLLKTLPLSPNGKVNRRALPEPDTERPEIEQAFVLPRTPVETVLAEIWAEVLGLELVGVYDGFISLGGSSLLATQVAARIREIFQVELPLNDVYRLPVAELAQRVEERGQAAQTDVAGIAQALIQINQISDSQAQSLLADGSYS